MARLETYTCDGCNAIKKDANHWWDVLVITERSGLGDRLNIMAHCDPAPPNTQQMCGIECAQKFIAQWMAKVASGEAEKE